MPKQSAPKELVRRKKGLCIEARCRKKATNGYLRCAKHAKQEWRKNNPIPAAYSRLKASAKKRGLEFSIDLDWFTHYCKAKGYPGNGMHLDRKDATKGYTKKNVRLLTPKENIAKGNKERATDRYKKAAVERKIQAYLNKKTENSVRQLDIPSIGLVDAPF